jgi:glycerophosphoryl diester phosphodiesterase
VDGIELDVHLSADGEIIVIHDETIDRTTNGKGFVNTLSLRELNAFRIDGKHQIQSERGFDLVNQDCFINIEIKSYEATDKVVSLIEKYVAKKKAGNTTDFSFQF